MPLRLESLKKRWPTLDLPILPFLAPRVFKPWPSRSHYGTQTHPKEPVDFVEGHYDHSLKSISTKRCSRGTLAQQNTSRTSLSGTTEQCLVQIQDALKDGLGGTGAGLKETSPLDVSIAKITTQHAVSEHSFATRTEKEIAILQGSTTIEDRIALPSHNLLGPGNMSTRNRNRGLRSPRNLRTGTVAHSLRRSGTFAREVEDRIETATRSLRKSGNFIRESQLMQGKSRISPSQTDVWMNREENVPALIDAGCEVVSELPIPFHSDQEEHMFWKTNKLVHHGSKRVHFEALHGSWHTRFAAITYGKAPLPFPTNEEPSTCGESGQAVDELMSMRAEILNIIRDTTMSSLRKFWTSLPHERALKMWMELMMTALEHYPTKALGVLSATCMEPYPPAYAVGDSLDYIISHYCSHPQTYPRRHLVDLAEGIGHILIHSRKGDQGGNSIDQPLLASNSLRLLMSVFDGSQLKKLYETMLQTKQVLHENTLIQFSYRFAKDGQTDTAFEVLQRLEGASFNSPQMLSLCTVILCHKYRDPEAFYTETTIFEFMINCGLTPNTITHNVLIWNSINSTDHTTAWKIHDMMVDAQIQPDKFTYSILLNDAKRRMDAVDIGRVMSFVRQEKIVDGYLVTDVLHAIYLLQQKKARDLRRSVKEMPLTALRSMLPVYCENFELGPLARIIPGLAEIATEEIEQHPSEASEKVILPPHDGVLTVMINAYLGAIRNADSAVQFYHNFRNLVYEGDPDVESLTKDSRIWDMILMTFGRFPELVNECAHIMEDMLTPVVKPIEESSSSVDEASDTEVSRPSHNTPQPELYTWSILLKVFMDQQQTAAAEKVLSLMKDRNVEPSIITWNTLAQGYVSIQDGDMVADAINRLEEANLTVDEATLTTLKKLKNRSRFLTKLAEKQKKRKVMNDLDEIVQSDCEPATGNDLDVFDENEWLEEEFRKEEPCL